LTLAPAWDVIIFGRVKGHSQLAWESSRYAISRLPALYSPEGTKEGPACPTFPAFPDTDTVSFNLRFDPIYFSISRFSAREFLPGILYGIIKK